MADAKILPSSMRMRLPDGSFVQIQARAGAANDDIGQDAQANFAELLDSTSGHEVEILNYLARMTPTIFPSADPTKIGRVVHGANDDGKDIIFHLIDSEKLGGVQVRGPRSKFLRNETVRNAIGALQRDERLEEFYLIAGRRADVATDLEESPPLPFRFNLLTWDHVAERLTVGIQGSNQPSAYTVILEATVTKCRTLLAALAKNPDIGRNIEGRVFEEIVFVLMSDIGFEEVELTPPASDGGRDVIARIRNSRTGSIETYLFECKHWVAGKKVHIKIVTHLQEVVIADRAKAGILVAWSGFGPEVLRQELVLAEKGIHLRDKDAITRWVSVWERTYSSPIFAPVNPLEVLDFAT